MSLLDTILKAARQAYLEGKLSEEELGRLCCVKRKKRFERHFTAKRARLNDDDLHLLAKFAAFNSIRPIEAELENLTEEIVSAWNAQPPYKDCFGLRDSKTSTLSIVRQFYMSIGATEGPRRRTRHLRLSTIGLDNAARVLRPYLPRGMAWAVSSGCHFDHTTDDIGRAPSHAENWLHEQFCSVEPILAASKTVSRGIIREVVQRTARMTEHIHGHD